MERYDTIVIGAGISGLLSALALTKERQRVLVLEKSGVLGGNCRTYEVGNTGYFVDTGAHTITELQEGPLTHLMKRYFSIVPTFVPHDRYYIRTESGRVKLPNTLQDLATFDAIPAKDRIVLTKLLIEAITKHAIYEKDETSVRQYVSKHNLSQETLRFLNALSYFLSGVSMDDTPVWRILSGGGMIHDGKRKMRRKIADVAHLMRQKFQDHGYPRGGIGSIVKCILHSMPDAEIRLMEDVKKITHKAGGFEVQTAKKSYSSRAVVYSGEAKMLPGLVSMPKMWSDSARKLKQSHAITLWLGLKVPASELMYRGSEVWFGEGVQYWAVPTSMYDPHLAPKGKQLVGFSAFMPENENPQKYEKRLLETIFSVIPGLEKNVDMKHTQTMVPEKAAVSVNVRFPSPKTPIENLYIVGTDADMRSMGLTRAAHSVVELLGAMNLAAQQ